MTKRCSVCQGSSPLTRGKRLPAFARFVRPGLIPAHAGKTRRGFGWIGCDGAHPRSRGENFSRLVMQNSPSGSSPLTRGKQGRCSSRCSQCGLIPAHAGKTTTSTPNQKTSRAHPRSRGENGERSVAENTARGSSPLTRGKPARRGRGPVHRGLIPAHAGKTRPVTWKPWRAAAHPRSRGENQTVYKQLSQWSGSSPLTRGKRTGRRRGRSQQRLIPAHAGKT